MRRAVVLVQALQHEQEIAHLQHEAQQLRKHNEELQAQLRSQGPDDRRVAELEGEGLFFRLRQSCVADTVQGLQASDVCASRWKHEKSSASDLSGMLLAEHRLGE